MKELHKPATAQLKMSPTEDIKVTESRTRRLSTSSYSHLVSKPAEMSPIEPNRAGSSIDLTQKLLAYLAQTDVLPGQRLPGERMLAEQMGVGRNVLREALKLLTVLGFLEVRQGDGTFLTNKTSNLLPRIVEWGLFLGDHSIEVLIEARSTLEVSLAGMAALKSTPEDLIKIEQLFGFMAEAANDGDIELFTSADIRFHLAIAKASGNPVLEGVLVNIRSLMQTWTKKVLQGHVDLNESLALHLPILSALKDRNPVAAEEAMGNHMVEAVKNLRQVTGHAPN